eukprot:Nitzschia sp. Nitz4//scaffold45_size130396//117407//119422//NITZ4_003472-RA/size130396-processed-gene-0.232-mRNA-1//-1//CDS//3329552467//176//frame0
MISRRRVAHDATRAGKTQATRATLRTRRRIRGSYGQSLTTKVLRISLWVSVGFLLVLCVRNPAEIVGMLKASGTPPIQDNPAPSIDEPQAMINEFVMDTEIENSVRKELKQEGIDFDKLQQEGLISPCQWGNTCSSQSSSKVLVRNALPFDRYFCDQLVEKNGGTREFELDSKSCTERGVSHVYTATPPTLSGSNSQPIELLWNLGMTAYADDVFSPTTFETEPFPCTIPCRKAGDYYLISTITVKGTPWQIVATMEGDQYYPLAEVKPDGYQRNQFYAVTSFQSEIPTPYFSWSEYKIQKPPVDFNRAIKGASFLANNCDSVNNREDTVLGLISAGLRVDSLSGCLHNAEPPPGVDMSNKTSVIREYLFHLSFENQCSQDYITEKLWGALEAGTLPVYFGAPNAKEHVPPHSVVFVNDFPSTQELADYLVKLTNDKELYDSYHAWRSRPLDQGFRNKYAFTDVHSTCRMCKWAYAMKHGLAWNHSAQEVQQPAIPHRTCRNNMGLVGHPFKEFWSDIDTGKEVAVKSATGKTCKLDASNRVLSIDDGNIQREVYNQDGVTDFWVLGNKRKQYTLKLVTPMPDGSLHNVDEGKEWWLQDQKSRMTLLFDQELEVHRVDHGSIQIIVMAPLRMRFILEDVDTFHTGARKWRSHFGSILKQDFMTPFDVFTYT